MDVDEDIDNYFKCLDDADRNWSIKEEESARKNLNMYILEDEVLEKLKTTKPGESTIQGVHTYDILANPKYIDEF